LKERDGGSVKCIRYSIPSSIPPNLDSKVCISSLLLSEKGVTSLCRRLINERRLIEMAFVPVNLYPILQVEFSLITDRQSFLPLSS
jgi:hypothetical protein